MRKLETLYYWNMDSITVPDGWNMAQVPDITRDNIKTIVDEHNKMVDTVNEIIKRLYPETK